MSDISMRAVRPIDAEVLKDNFPLPLFEDMPKSKTISEIREAIRNTQTLDVTPVVHAYWNKKFDRKGMIAECSHCHMQAPLNYDQQPILSMYCGYCGARMDEVKKNERLLLHL